MLFAVLADMITSSVLAQSPEQGNYFSPVYIAVFFLAVLLWAHNTAWVQADIKRVKLPPTLWPPLVFGVGALCLVVWPLVPIFWAGLAIFAVGYGTVIIIYVVIRNKRVSPSQTVLTPAHLRRLTQGDKVKLSAEAAHAKDKVRIRNFEDKMPPWPTDPAEHAGYQALQDLLFDAIWRRASDVRLDFVPEQPVKVIYKVDGVDRACEPIDAQLGPYILNHFKRIAGMNVEERRKPQSGKFNATIGAGGESDKAVDIEARASGTTSGERVLLKMIAEESKFRPPDLGLLPEQLAVFQQIIALPKGVVLVTGPRGSGVTATLYAILRSHDAFMQNIHTLEIQKSMTLENITQHLYDASDGNVSFGNRWRSIIRMEPDVAMAGDTPDNDTMSFAADAGRQNKKLYLGMTAKSCLAALRRYLDGVANNPLAAVSLLAITNQRLVRILCTNCRKAYRPDPALLKKGNLPMGENRPFYRPPNPEEIETDKHGNQLICPVCQGSGYLGRTGVFEMLVIDDGLRRLIGTGGDLEAIKTEARKKGLLYLQEVALRKVYDGVTSINEVLRVTKDDSAGA